MTTRREVIALERPTPDLDQAFGGFGPGGARETEGRERRDGGFTAEGKSADGASVTLSAFAEARGRASGLLNIEAGNRHSYDGTGPLHRSGRCWQNAGVKACAWKPGTRLQSMPCFSSADISPKVMSAPSGRNIGS